MPLTIPAFVQYQSPMFPLRGLWNHAPKEGDYFVNAEIDWLTSPPGNAVQFALAGNSPVALSQIVALAVDNGRSGADVDFIFPDSGFVLTVPAHNQLISPVFTNALMFYASAPSAVLGDTTVLQILNSIPPPIPIAPSAAQNHAGIVGVAIINGTTPLVPAGVTGTLNTISIVIDGAAAGIFQLQLIDGSGKTVWLASPQVTAGGPSIPLNLTGLAIRFVNGLSLLISGAAASLGVIQCNVYFTTP